MLKISQTYLCIIIFPKYAKIFVERKRTHYISIARIRSLKVYAQVNKIKRMSLLPLVFHRSAGVRIPIFKRTL